MLENRIPKINKMKFFSIEIASLKNLLEMLMKIKDTKNTQTTIDDVTATALFYHLLFEYSF